jgi:class 3 adenylate cyclase
MKEREELAKKYELNYLLRNVEKAARSVLLRDTEFVKQFEEASEMFVMSVDIRRSTELMLKPTNPDLFAKFITRLCEELRQLIWNNHGVFEKFTGDGILAFFPRFYSGVDAGYFAINAASQCHRAFEQVHDEHRYCFDTVLKDVGLGIGIDYRMSHLVRQWDSLTIVGKPVVYACRLGGAPPGRTLLNQQAYAETAQHYAS